MGIGKKILIGIGGTFAAFVVLGAITSGSADESTGNASPDASAASTASVASTVSRTPLAASTSALSTGGCLRIEEAWGSVANALAGLESTVTIEDAAKALASAAEVWSGSALLVRDRGDAAMAAKINQSANAALKLRVKLLNGDPEGIPALADTLTNVMGNTVVPACEAVLK